MLRQLSENNTEVRCFPYFQDAYVYLKNPPPEFLPKVGVITVSGLTGLVLARKGKELHSLSLHVLKALFYLKI